MNGDYLDRILSRKREEIHALRSRAEELKARALDAPPARPWAPALRRERVALIAEIKRRAPSAGSLNPDLDPTDLAGTYESAGAAGLSVLTDRDFDGRLADLEQARVSVAIPALRKDFVLDAVQLYESRAAGADAVLLIVRALSAGQLEEMLGLAAELGLGTLVEVHDDKETNVALTSGAPVIGINNRDLRTFEIDIVTSRRLAAHVPGDRVLVAESGIDSAEQVRDLGERGVDAVLVGRALVSHADPGQLARELASQPRRPRA